MIRDKLIWKINRFRIRHTPERILKKFVNGKYLDYTDYCDGTVRRRGCLSWRRTERLIDRCLNCGMYIKSHQDLNVDPLGDTYLETYCFLTGKELETVRI